MNRETQINHSNAKNLQRCQQWSDTPRDVKGINEFKGKGILVYTYGKVSGWKQTNLSYRPTLVISNLDRMSLSFITLNKLKLAW